MSCKWSLLLWKHDFWTKMCSRAKIDRGVAFSFNFSRPFSGQVNMVWYKVFLLYWIPRSINNSGKLPCFQRSLTRKLAEGPLLRRASWFSGKLCVVFLGHVCADYLIWTVSKFESTGDLILDSLPPKSVPKTWMSIHQLSGSPLRSRR